MAKKFHRVFVPNYNYRFSSEPLLKIADEIVYVCETPMFDDLIGSEYKDRFEFRVRERMNDYDSETDLIAFYGDPLIFAIMIALAFEEASDVTVARFSSKADEYKIRKISADDIVPVKAERE